MLENVAYWEHPVCPLCLDPRSLDKTGCCESFLCPRRQQMYWVDYPCILVDLLITLECFAPLFPFGLIGPTSFPGSTAWLIHLHWEYKEEREMFVIP